MVIDQLDEMVAFSKIAPAAVFDEVTLPTVCDEGGGVSRPIEGDGEIVNDSCAGIAPRLTPHRQRQYQEPLDPHEQAQIEQRQCLVVHEPFGNGRVFSSFEELKSEHKRFSADRFTQFRVRSSETADHANKELEKKRGGKPRDQEFIDSLITVEYKTIWLRCCRGPRQKSRARKKKKANAQDGTTDGSEVGCEDQTETRRVKKTQHTGCPARIRGSAFKDTDGVWKVVTSNEVVAHNHRCSADTLNAISRSALLDSPHILEDAKSQMMAGAHAANICDSLNAHYGTNITPKMLANVKRDRLGGKTAIENLKLLVTRFSTFAGSRSLLMNDKLGNLCGIVTQSAAQREFFRRFGDNLVMDWTHNTNNLGFYLGSLMVTSVTGHGVSVVDFLCMDQRKPTMDAVLSWFISMNPGAVQHVKSVVIDKDYTEWAVLRERFPEARVLLCQFHAIKWFGTVLYKKRYNIKPRLRAKVYDILYDMVYERTVEGFEVLQSRLHDLLHKSSPKFLTYMEQRWYSCRPMWSDCERGSVFTALNTTTNRIESAWNQIKKVLGKKLRIDLCLEAIFAYQTAVLTREYNEVNDYASLIVLRSDAHAFIRPALCEMCDYAAQAVEREWVSFVQHDVDMVDPYVIMPNLTPTVSESYPSLMVSRLAADSSTYIVNPNDWTCSCSFNTTSSLPCRHVLLVARRHLGLDSLPTDCIHTRWRMRDTADILPRLRLWRAEVQSLRTALLLADDAFTHLIGAEFFEDESDSALRRPRRIAYYQLQRGEEADGVVFNNLEKRGVLIAEFARLTKYLIRQSTPKFIDLVHELHEVLRDLLLRWTGPCKAGTATAGNAGADDTISETASLCGEDEDDEREDEAPVDLDEELAALMAAAEISHRQKTKSGHRGQGGDWTVNADLNGSPAVTVTQETDTLGVVAFNKDSISVGANASGTIAAPVPTQVRAAVNPAMTLPLTVAVPMATAVEPSPIADPKPTVSPATNASSCMGLSTFPFPELELGPLDDTSSVATADISELVHPVAQHAAKNGSVGSPMEDASSTTRSFKPPSNISAVMDAVARYNMGQPSTEPQRARNPLKRPKAAATVARRTVTLRDVFSSDSDY